MHDLIIIKTQFFDPSRLFSSLYIIHAHCISPNIIKTSSHFRQKVRNTNTRTLTTEHAINMQHANPRTHTHSPTLTHALNVGNTVDRWGRSLLFCVCVCAHVRIRARAVNLDVMSSGSDALEVLCDQWGGWGGSVVRSGGQQDRQVSGGCGFWYTVVLLKQQVKGQKCETTMYEPGCTHWVNHATFLTLCFVFFLAKLLTANFLSISATAS